MEIVNPYRPVAEFVLADGVSRKFVWDLNAMAAFETVGAGLQPSQQAALMRALLFAGMFEDARKRGRGVDAGEGWGARASFSARFVTRASAANQATGGEWSGGIQRGRRRKRKAHAFDFKTALKLASSRLGLLPAQTFELTLYELNLMLEGWEERDLIARRFQAGLVAELMNISGKYLKKRITGDTLLGLDENGKRLKRKKATTKEKLILEAKKRNRTYADYLSEHGQASSAGA
jgi:hypothetical protein